MPDPLDTLPTCWYCPECGYVCSVETAHARWTDINRGNVSAGFCPGSMVEVPIVPPAASLEQRHTILRLLGYEVRTRIECPKCDGHGWMVECCGKAYATGDCCGDAVHVKCDCEPVPVLILRDQRETTGEGER